MAPLIEAQGLRRSFAGLPAVDGVSLSVEAGEIYALLGPDGAGKTTTIRLLCGALRCDAGEVRLAAYDLRRQAEQARAQIGYLPQRFSLYGEMTVLENLRFFAEVRGLPTSRWALRSQEILEFVGLAEFGNRRADELSGGMRQKLGLAAALVHQPRILLLDEPTGGVDPVTRQSFWQLLIQLLGEGVAVLLSTPYMDEASRCSRIGFMSRGQLLLEGRPSEITGRLAGRVLEVVAEPRRRSQAAARGAPAVEDVHAFGDRLHVRTNVAANQGLVERLRTHLTGQGVSVHSIRPVAPQLEDVFLALLQRQGLSAQPKASPGEVD
ncbi:MAG: ABC transporter ATP-binding protein [Chloroflexota bacterium]